MRFRYGILGGMGDLRVVGSLSPDAFARLAGADRAETLEDVLAWCVTHASDIVDVIVQDEFTHDVVVRGPAPAYLCFDTT